MAPIMTSAGQKRKQPTEDTDWPLLGNNTLARGGPTSDTSTVGNSSTMNTGQETKAMNWDDLRSKILNGMATDLPSACSAIAELRDNFELVHSTEYPTMLSTLLPVFGSILKTVPCMPPRNAHASSSSLQHHHKDTEMRSPDGSGGGSGAQSHAEKEKEEEKPEHRIRHATLEICSRLPQNEVLRPYAGSLLEIAMKVLHSDYEDNALLAARLVFDLHKSYRPMLADYVQPFLDFVHMSYRNFPKSVQANFMISGDYKQSDALAVGTGTSGVHAASDTSAYVPSAVPAPSAATTESRLIVKSTASFRVLTECPLTVMLLFQLYPKYIKSNLLQLLPLMMEALAQKPPPHATAFLTVPDSPKKAVSAASNSGESNEQVVLKVLFRKRARELLSAQVKTLSFVTHLLRGYGEHIRPYEDKLATNVLSLFQMCPREALTTRKDLLLALRHIFATNFRKAFFKHVDTLLDERLLIGKHRQSEHAHLRASAYSTLADLLVNVRSRLTMAQISRVVHLYSRVLHDASMNLPLVVQTASVRLLANMVDPVYHNKEEKASLGRDILFRILETFVWKLEMLVDHGIANVRKAANLSTRVSDDTEEHSEPVRNGIESAAGDEKAIREFMYGSQLAESPGTIQNIRELIKPLLACMKTLIWCINNYGNQRDKIMSSKDKTADPKARSNSDTSSRQRLWYEELAVQSINVAERGLIEKYFVWTLDALKVFKEDDPDGTDANKSVKEYRDVLESFASSLSVLDTFNFQRVVGPQMQLLIESIADDEDLLVVPQTFLLQNLNVTSDFASCLLHFLMKDADTLDLGIDESGDEKSRRTAEVKMKLFGLMFSSLAVYPKNEKILRPFLQQLIAVCLRRAMGSDVKYWPGNHFTVLRQLFRAITGGKFEELYKEILPLLPTLLNGVYRVYCHTEHAILKNIMIELSLTIPARLSSLLPHLSLLLRIIVQALQTGDSDLINLGYVFHL